MQDNTAPFSRSGDQLKVLDLGTQFAGPFAATVLGDFGAEVIKCEQPGTGDPLRLPDGMSPRWQAVGANKRSITLNLRVPEGQDLLRRLVGWADVLIENFRSGTMDKWGIGYEALSKVNPRLVYVAVSGFGTGGPYTQMSGYDFVGSALGGATALTGYPDQPPVLPGVGATDFTSGLFAAIGALEAVRRRDAAGGSGRGAFVDMALYESMLRLISAEMADYTLDGVLRERAGGSPRRDGKPELPMWYSYRTRDGRYLAMQPVTIGQITDLRALIGDPALDDPKFENQKGRMANSGELYDILSRWVAAHDFDEIWDILKTTSVPAGPVNTIPDILADPHIRARGSLVAVRNGKGQDFVLPSATPRMTGNDPAPRWTGEPLGASTRHVYAELLGLGDTDLRGAARSRHHLTAAGHRGDTDVIDS